MCDRFVVFGADDKATMMEVDHETRQVFVEQMKMVSPDEMRVLHPSHEMVGARLTAPIVTTYIDTDKISFERWVDISVLIFLHHYSFNLFYCYST